MTVKGILYRLIKGMSQEEYDLRATYDLTECDKAYQLAKNAAVGLRDSCELYEFE